MKFLIISIAALLLAACSSTPPPTSNVDSDWQAFGYERAMKGWIVQSESKLAKLADGKTVSEANYQAYTAGYNKGQEEYCDQSAYMLGVVGKQYNGICDKLDPFFRQDYVSGMQSTAGGM
ncbi:DUF2799 domain-containing protein [Aliivibrio sp. EL58]|uniref:DUF2799 domain-containing protein n=1 Tax=Aliivibrio sp. EL58 TaxID=2107582 RepID=UPI000EFAE02B|nr:DUF2799 domain-containing protein [Aliivibrio sp. EL58]